MPEPIKYIKTKTFVLNTIDWFYPLFRPILDLQTFRYLAVGGSNTLLDIFLYFISYNFIIDKQVIYLSSQVAISPHIAAFIIAFLVTFPLGFMLMRGLVFPESVLRGRVQLVRYFSVAMLNIVLNYVLLRVLVEQFHFFPTPSKIITTGIVIIVSYLLQRFFTFKS
ncbi:GtrA family protein [uncultured Sunxiuqinia sp.]|uniref:GtrA family protein n=1 Tax=uncultured Sunxiuqinia sp. TaxID=1573825 RepID=UPI00261050F0|nr:GtrA family protein [uncultured Sunxiuqinia sp.]